MSAAWKPQQSLDSRDVLVVVSDQVESRAKDQNSHSLHVHDPLSPVGRASIIRHSLKHCFSR